MTTAPPLHVAIATADDAEAIAMVRAAAGRDLATRFGPGPWASEPTPRGVLAGMRDAEVLVARGAGAIAAAIVATCRLSKRRPWAIDPSYFTRVARPLYLTDMAVRPDHQRRGVGRVLLAEAARRGRTLGADAIRLDAYDAEAGAGEFYERCGFTACGGTVYRGVALAYYEMLL